MLNEVHESPLTALAAPLRYEPAMERLETDEAETNKALLETLLKISETTFEHGGHGLRSVHAKSHGLLKGELRVLDPLPASLSHGLAARSGSYPIMIRFSTTPGDILDDSISTPRGMSIKVVGVEGERLHGSENDATQDFVLVNGPAFVAPNTKKFLSSLKLLAATTDKAEGAKKAASAVLRGVETVIEAFGHKSATVTSLGGQGETHILGDTFYSQARCFGVPTWPRWPSPPFQPS